MSFIRKIKKKDAVYLAEVESYRADGKVKQRVIRYVGKEVNGQPVKRIPSDSIEITAVKQYLDYHVLHTIAERLGLPALLGEDAKRILLLVYTQLITRKPIYKLPDYVEQTALKEILGLDKLVDKQLYEALDRLEELDFALIEDRVFAALSSHRKERNAMVLDVTDTYFNGSQADWKSRKGKDGKYDKLIQIALAVTKEEGFPILHRLYEGNIGNTKIFQDTLADARLKKFDIIVLDRGMICKESIRDLIAINQKVITGLRLHNEIKTNFISTIDREQIFQPAHRVKLKNTEVYIQDFEYEAGTLLAIYNPELETAKRQHAMLNTETYKPEEAKYMGFSLIYHTTNLDNSEVVKTYYEKDIVEKAYRELKTTVNLHPIRKYRLSHIKAHVKICYLAYAILAYMQYKVKPKQISAIYALEQLQSVYKVTLESKLENLIWDKTVTLKKEQIKILSLLDCSV
jgi:transposase